MKFKAGLLLLSVMFFAQGKSQKRVEPGDKRRHSNIASKTPVFIEDTSLYLERKFIENKETYIGKRFGVLLDSLDIPFKSFLYSPNHSNRYIANDVSFSFYDATDRGRKYTNNKHTALLIVIWQTPPSTDSLIKLLRQDRGNWTPEVEKYLKEKIVKDILIPRSQQSVKPAKPTDTSNNISKTPQIEDTIRSIDKKLTEKRETFTGKKFGVLLDSLDIPFKSFEFPPYGNSKFIVDRVTFSFYKPEEQRDKLMKGINPILVIIAWETPLSRDSLNVFSRLGKGDWTPAAEAYFREKVVKDIIMVMQQITGSRMFDNRHKSLPPENPLTVITDASYISSL